MPEKNATSKTENADLPFEDALARLEDLVRGMESDEMPLEDLIKNYEEGSRLFVVCEKRLEEAQGRIEIIRKKRSGERVLEPFGETSNGQADQASPIETESDPSQDNGELF